MGTKLARETAKHIRCLEYGTDGALAGVRGRGPLSVQRSHGRYPFLGGQKVGNTQAGKGFLRLAHV